MFIKLDPKLFGNDLASKLAIVSFVNHPISSGILFALTIASQVTVSSSMLNEV